MGDMTVQVECKDLSGLEQVQCILTAARLDVAGDRIGIVKPDAVDFLAPHLIKIDRSAGEALLGLPRDVRDALPDAPLSFGRGLLHKALHKSLHKSLHKGLHKSLHKAAFGAGGGAALADGLTWPTIEVPWRELGRLYDKKTEFRWDRFDQTEMPPPPAVRDRLAEIPRLHVLQEELRQPEQAFRRDRIRIEATNDLTAYMLPLGADVTTPGSQTAIMFQTILWLGSLIGLLYKERFNAPRPHVLDPTLEPFIPVPAYSSYPSNHAFQSFLIAEVFARAIPEHPGGAALYRAAAEVARNREWAGLHIESDTIAGQTLARLCAPLFELILVDQIRDVRAEWLGEGYSA